MAYSRGLKALRMRIGFGVCYEYRYYENTGDIIRILFIAITMLIAIVLLLLTIVPIISRRRTILV